MGILHKEFHYYDSLNQSNPSNHSNWFIYEQHNLKDDSHVAISLNDLHRCDILLQLLIRFFLESWAYR